VDELLRRQAKLRSAADRLLAELDLAGLFADIGPVLLTGSYVSGLMTWPELDVMLLARPDFSPHDMLGLLRRVVDLQGVTGFDYRDERGAKRPTEHIRDERYHVGITVDRDDEPWHIDLSVWLHDIHANVTEWHEQLRDDITPEQRAAVLLIKDVWHRRPEYPDQVGGLDVYTAVREDGVRTPEQFAAWLAKRGHPGYG
jgi:hypothetical protein